MTSGLSAPGAGSPSGTVGFTDNGFKKLFGRVPPNHAKGCLQDIHWAAALFGYFPNYALGEALAAQLFERAKKDDGALLPALRQGDFKPYFNWVRPRIHEQASLKSFDDIVIAATGSKLSGEALKRHLRAPVAASASLKVNK